MKQTVLGKRFLLLSLCFVCNVSVASNHSNDPARHSNFEYSSKTALPQAWEIHTTDIKLAQKIAISLHNQLFAVDYDKGVIIATLSEQDKLLLRAKGAEIKRATSWQQQYQQFLQKINRAVELSQHTKTTAGIPGFSCYPTVEETYQQAQSLAASYPNLAEWIDIGDSWQKVDSNGNAGYDLMVLKITNRSNNQADKPILFIHSAMHAREYTPAALTLDFADELLNNYQSNPDYRWIIDHQEIHVLFHMNPDGRKVAESGILQRKNVNQNHCPNATVGVDLNRNFAFFWNTTTNGSSGDECSEVYRGSGPESEPETQAVSNYIRSLYADNRGELDTDGAPANTPGLHLDIHSYSKLILWPWGHTDHPSPNAAAFEQLGSKLAFFNHYSPTQSVGLYPTDGTSDDVSYGELGVAALTFELGSDFFEPCENYTQRIKPDNLKALAYAASITRAPYLLPSGPDITEATLNSQSQRLEATNNATVELRVSSATTNTWPNTNSQKVNAIQYTIDTPIWQASNALTELTAADGSFDSASESAVASIDVSALSRGEHMLYLRAINQQGQAGPPKAIFIDIGDNNSPIADFTYSCTELSCDFDAGSSSDSDGQIVSWVWEFVEDNTTLVGASATTNFVFASGGDKTVILRIADDKGAGAQISKTLNVQNSIIDVETQSVSSGGGSLGVVIYGLLLLGFKRK